ncbi:NrfD/PsrC family molybdoenzyme membrane anchor subunit [Adlercreutzia sp. ZJ242]|uniref:NrfD/PsrC family molybdoenzyme membrane anchor subunit n=1 Tax=Adlercreutzia sp. ZJ242 TaxID=2709409 RepID=UPI0013ECF545|nr:NrfD/PsrC family molybdoenzyme membrane anchor subunit [Adlercreutzia sp. ZJ242]
MFGELVIAYLFFAGVGAGGTVVTSLADLLMVRESFGIDAVTDVAEKCPVERLTALTLIASCVAMALGAASLALDLGRFDRVLSLFLAPPTTFMNVGAWSVALLLVVLMALVLVRVLYLPWVGRMAVVALEVVAITLAAVVAVYVGLLLGTLAGMRLWSCAWVPVLFVLSAASCGCALFMAGSLFVEGDRAVARLVSWVVRIDVAVIAVEALVAALFLAFVLGSEHPGVQVSAASLMTGEAALPWWIGFIVCGVSAPLVIEAVCFVCDRWVVGATAYPAVAIALAGALVLVGAVGMRDAIVDAAAQRNLELQDPAMVSAEEDEKTQEIISSSAASADVSVNREDFSTWLSYGKLSQLGICSNWMNPVPFPSGYN